MKIIELEIFWYSLIESVSWSSLLGGRFTSEGPRNWKENGGPRSFVSASFFSTDVSSLQAKSLWVRVRYYIFWNKTKIDLDIVKNVIVGFT